MEFKHDINKKLEHKSIRERDENETLYEGIVLVKKEIQKQQFIIIQMKWNKNGKTQWKSSKP